MVVVGKCFLYQLITTTIGVVGHKVNSEQLIAYPIVILQQNKGAKISKYMLFQILHILYLFEKEEFEARTENTVATNWRHQPTVQQQETEDHVCKVFFRMLL